MRSWSGPDPVHFQLKWSIQWSIACCYCYISICRINQGIGYLIWLYSCINKVINPSWGNTGFSSSCCLPIYSFCRESRKRSRNGWKVWRVQGVRRDLLRLPLHPYLYGEFDSILNYLWFQSFDVNTLLQRQARRVSESHKTGLLHVYCLYRQETRHMFCWSLLSHIL